MTEPHEPPPPPISTPAPALRLSDLLRELPGATVLPVPPLLDAVILGVHHDSRAVVPGDLFVAREGAAVSGLDFVDEALKRGAVAVLARRGAVVGHLSVPLVEVDDVALALALASSAVYGHPTFGLDVVGITGTNGKTTTAELVWSMLARCGERSGKIGTLGYRFEEFTGSTLHTSPEADELARLARSMRDRGATHLTMEVSSIALSAKRVDGVRFRVAAFTNLTQDHLDFHGDMESYAAAKRRLFLELQPAAAAVNIQDPEGKKLRDVLPPEVRALSFACASDSGADVAPINCEFGRDGIALTVQTPHGIATIRSSLWGAHNVENLLCALTIGLLLDVPLSELSSGLSGEINIPGRLERCDQVGRDDVVVLVDYAHTPDALSRALASVRAFTTGRVHCVFGCGGDRDPSKRAPMGEAAGRSADLATVTNDNPRSEDPNLIADEVLTGLRATNTPHHVELDRNKAILRAVTLAAPGDVVLIAGKGHETYQIVGERTLAFDDRLVAREALGVRRKLGSQP